MTPFSKTTGTTELQMETKNVDNSGGSGGSGGVDSSSSSNSSSKGIAVHLIDEEWAAPSLAIYDFANFIMVLRLFRLRERKNFTDDFIRAALLTMAEAYLRKTKKMTAMMMKEKKKKEKKSNNLASKDGKVDHVIDDEDDEEDNDDDDSHFEDLAKSFVEDAFSFVPVVALTHCFSNLIHASKEGQLTSAIPVDDRLYDAKGTFNWLRHATDHFRLYKEAASSSSS